MAIYHLSAKPISRAQGRSATGAAAYRAGVEITDERTGLVHDYSRKCGVLHAELILPGDATADRAAFWNRIEAHHKRGDAVLVREVEISLPTELSAEQRQVLAVGYARELADRYGVAADVALHAPRPVTDRDLEKTPDQRWEIDPDTGRRHNGNWHAHIMLSACHVAPDGTLGKKAVELDPIHCQRAKIENMADRERARWGDLANTALERHGHEARIDHRSHAARGIDAEPTPHLGPAASGYERRTGKPSRKRQDFDQEAAERLARAREAGELERQGQTLDRSIIDTSGDIAAALRERGQLQALEAQQAQQARQQALEAAEQQRIERLSAAELRAEVARLRPLPVRDLVERDPAVIEAERQRQAYQAQYQQGQAREAQAQREAADWRDAHPIRAKMHDAGLISSDFLIEREQEREQARADWLSAAPRIEDASQRVGYARTQAEVRATIDTAPARARADVLETIVQQQQQQQRQELEQQRRQRERDAVPKAFASMALKRELRMNGFTDRSSNWQNTPKPLRDLIDGYNAAPKEARPVVLERLLGEPGRWEQVRELMATQRENRRGLSR
ncbi:MAG: hypothetical protein RLZ81_1580 [Pseudomonadota bacterium]